MSTTTIKPKFQSANIAATRGVIEHFDQYPEQLAAAKLAKLLRDHFAGIWGNVPEEDAKSNDEGVIKQDRALHSSFDVDGTKVWVITEWDRSVTTILFPDEY